MALNFVDRMLTVVATATLTSAVWIVAGGSLIKNAGDETGEDSVRPAVAAPSPAAEQIALTAPIGESDRAAPPDAAQASPPSLDTKVASQPTQGVSGGLMIPVLNVRPSDLTDTYTISSSDGARLHEAIDIMAPAGTSVVSAGPGTIEKLFTSVAGGLTIYVRSTDRETIHYYSHLQEYAEGLQEGQRIRRGQRLGTVGSTGNASAEAPHLHFAILRTTADAQWWEPANAVNPYPLLTKR